MLVIAEKVKREWASEGYRPMSEILQVVRV
jgi:hypothetical protein